MLEFLIMVLFCWLAFKVIGLAFKVAWGATKIIASILLVLAVPMLIVCLLFAGGMILLAPVALIGIAFALLKKCVIKPEPEKPYESPCCLKTRQGVSVACRKSSFFSTGCGKTARKSRAVCYEAQSSFFASSMILA